MERHVPEFYDLVQKNKEAAPERRCAILDVVSWFPGVLQQLWIDVSVRCPHTERYNESASKPGVPAVAGEAEETKRYGTAVRAFGLRDSRKTGRRGHQVAARFGDYGGGKWKVQPACCWTMENPAGASIADCTSRHTLESAGIQSRTAACC